MSLTQGIWIAGVIVFFIVGKSISNAIYALAYRLENSLRLQVELTNNRIDPLKVTLATDSIDPLEVALKNGILDPLNVNVNVDPLDAKVELTNYIRPLEVQLDNHIIGPVKVEPHNKGNLPIEGEQP